MGLFCPAEPMIQLDNCAKLRAGVSVAVPVGHKPYSLSARDLSDRRSRHRGGSSYNRGIYNGYAGIVWSIL